MVCALDEKGVRGKVIRPGPEPGALEGISSLANSIFFDRGTDPDTSPWRPEHSGEGRWRDGAPRGHYAGTPSGMVFDPSQSAATSRVTFPGVRSGFRPGQRGPADRRLRWVSRLDVGERHGHQRVPRGASVDTDGQPTLVDATITSHHLVLWISATIFIVTALVSAILFRKGLPFRQRAHPSCARDGRCHT